MLPAMLATRRTAAAAAALVPALLSQQQHAYTIGGESGGGSQQKAKELQARLPPYKVNKEPVVIAHKLGLALLHDPWFNKGAAFPLAERERLGVRGLVPPRVMSMQSQEARFMDDYRHGVSMIPPEEVATGGVTSEMARRWLLLQNLHDRNETLYFRVLISNFEEMAPIVYTPTVGWVCSNYQRLYRRPRGMFFSAQDKGHMAAMVYNWPQDDVHAIVVTDGSRILGLGDLGVQGLGIPIGKLDIYCAAAGFSPAHVLPVVLDVGTDNVKLRSDPLYMGLQQPRIQGAEYYELLDEFVNAVTARWPHAVLQFEDFSMQHALTLLERYRRHHLVFNDDVQGTAATALAGLYGALRVLGQPAEALAQQRIVCVGAGSAGMGVVQMIAAGMVKRGGLTPEQAAANFWVLDAAGLITACRPGLPDYVERFARREPGAAEGAGLLDVVRSVKPTIILGLAGAGKLFTEEVLRAVADGCERPIVFPLSNPISKMECTSKEAVVATDGRCIFASGSPQPEVVHNGVTHEVSQSNNMYVFPGIALGAYLGRTGIITDTMMMAAAESLELVLSEEDVTAGRVYPRLKNIREISARVAAEVIKAAGEEGHLGDEAAAQLAKGDEALMAWVRKAMFVAQYASIGYLPPGIGE